MLCLMLKDRALYTLGLVCAGGVERCPCGDRSHQQYSKVEPGRRVQGAQTNNLVSSFLKLDKATNARDSYHW